MKKLIEYSMEEIADQEPQIISELLDKWQHIKKTGEALEKRAKQILEDGGEIENWGLKSGAVRKSISDISEAVKLLLANDVSGLTPNDLLEICSIPHTKIAEKIIVKTGCTKKEAQFIVEQTLGDLLTETHNKPSLKRVSKSA
jgi:hypothetical protein